MKINKGFCSNRSKQKVYRAYLDFDYQNVIEKVNLDNIDFIKIITETIKVTKTRVSCIYFHNRLLKNYF